jgi:PTH1 family peptidyl-tRNA hydrolase
LVGLGNPGPDYAKTRHNIGFMAADAIAEAHRFPSWKNKFKAQISEQDLGGQRTLLAKPQTHMNLSGESVGEIMRFYKLTPNDVIVMHDELDLAPGKVKVKQGGGSAGHNGLKSLDEHIGPDYWRARLGIGHPGDKDLVTNYVLGPFAKADREWLEMLVAAIAKHSPLLAAGKTNDFMTRLAEAMPRAAKDESSGD